MVSFPLAPERGARLLLRAVGYNPDQPRDEQGRWTNGVGFDEDPSERYPKAPDTRSYDDAEARRAISIVKKAGRLNDDGTISLFHATVHDTKSIEKRGLVPAFKEAPGQDWKATHSDYATYFHLDEDTAQRDIEYGGSVVEARIPLTRLTLGRFLPDEDTSADPTYGLERIVREGGAVAFIGGVPASAVRVRKTRALEFDLNQPRDESGRWTSEGADASFPKAGSVVDGRTVLDHVPNRDSIESSLSDYEVLPGVREISMSSMDPSYKVRPYSKSESDRLDRLQVKIEQSKTISPLIIVVDKEKHPYILEGGHRFDALRRMRAKSFPALVVIDTESLKGLAASVNQSSIDLAARAFEPKLSVAFRYAFAKGRKAARRGPDAAARAVAKALKGVLEPTLLKAIAAGGDAGLGMLKKLKTAAAGDGKPFRWRFDASNEDARRWAKRHAGELITQVSDTTRERVRRAVALQQETGDDSWDAIEAAVGSDERADLIARTETMIAANEGQRQGWGQAVDAGLLPEDARRAWITTPGCCDECDSLEGTEADLDGEYPEPGGEGPPLHPNCRCTEGIVG